jgi:hypothetical protein
MSCHPYEHKRAAINYMYNRVHTYKLTKENKNKEEDITAQILENNEYPPQIKNKDKKKSPTNNKIQKDKWITFTYFGPSIRMVTKLFQNTRSKKVAFRTSNTIQHVKAREKTTDIYSLSGVYKMACKDCPLKYIRQMGHTFWIRYKEHIRGIKTNGQWSKFAQHILDKMHNNTIERTMEILHTEGKGKMLNALESYHIYRLTKQRLRMNEALTDT